MLWKKNVIVAVTLKANVTVINARYKQKQLGIIF